MKGKNKSVEDDEYVFRYGKLLWVPSEIGFFLECFMLIVAPNYNSTVIEKHA